MDDFFQQVYFDNSVKDLLITLAIILVVILLNRLISKYLAEIIFLFVKRIWKNLDHKAFIKLVIHPIGMFLVFFVSIAALHRLQFPGLWNVQIYRLSIKEILHGSGTIILIVSFIWLLLRIIDFIALVLQQKADTTAGQNDTQLIVFFKDFFKVILAILGIIMILHFAFRFAVGNLLTGLSIVGAALALSLRESLENLIASFIIFFNKPFTTGDLVKVQNVTGVVEKIGLRSTRLRSDQKTYVTVPNKQMVDTIIDNLTLRTQRKGELKLELPATTSSEKLEKLLASIREILRKKSIQSSDLYLESITKNSFFISGEYFTEPFTQEEFNAMKEEINLAVLKLMEAIKSEAGKG